MEPILTFMDRPVVRTFHLHRKTHPIRIRHHRHDVMAIIHLVLPMDPTGNFRLRRVVTATLPLMRIILMLHRVSLLREGPL